MKNFLWKFLLYKKNKTQRENNFCIIRQIPAIKYIFFSTQIQDAGFEIVAHEERTLSESEAQKFYQHKAAEVV